VKENEKDEGIVSRWDRTRDDEMSLVEVVLCWDNWWLSNSAPHIDTHPAFSLSFYLYLLLSISKHLVVESESMLFVADHELQHFHFSVIDGGGQ